MPTQQTPALRMYCLCGQKMRLNETMYGRRARCIACQLKIRIPRFEEVPKGTAEIYLRDHPEFIREETKAGEAAQAEDKAKERRRKSISVPIDPSGTLRELCSLDKKLKRELKDTNGRSRAELEAYRTRLKEIRTAFDDELHQRLMEAAIELTAAQEKLAELNLAARVGEVEYQAYLEQANRVRWRRECLERRQVNLRAWLAVRDADLAGGYVDLPFAHMEEVTLRSPLTEDTPEPAVLLRWMVDQLRTGFAERKQAEQSLDTVMHMREQGDLAEKEGKRAAKEQKAVRARATAAIRFWQDRLEHFKKDIKLDRGVLEAQLDLARGRRQLGDLGRDQFDALERELRQAKADLEKALQTIERAITAPSDRDLPALRGTFLQRMGKPSTAPRGRGPVTVFAILGLIFMVAIVLGVIFGVMYGLIPVPPFTRGPAGAPSTEITAGASVGEMSETIEPEPAAETPPVAEPAGEVVPEPVLLPPISPMEEPDTEPAEPAPTGENPETEAPAEAMEEPEPSSEEALESEGETDAQERASNPTNALKVELRGVVMTADKAPRFFLRIHTPDGESRERVRELGGGVADGWIIREYNPDTQSITLFNGDDLLVVRRGETETLPAVEEQKP